jgi:hypothetical protein
LLPGSHDIPRSRTAGRAVFRDTAACATSGQNARGFIIAPCDDIPSLARIEVTLTTSETEALLLEYNLMR